MPAWRERGSITGLYTVLVEGDDMNEPIADTARSILDGHVQLSRQLAESNHYPAVDVLGSISRLAPAITDPETIAAAGEVRRMLSAWRDAKDLIEIDAYVPGTNPVVDKAIAFKPAIDAYTRQAMSEQSRSRADAGRPAHPRRLGGRVMKAYSFRLGAVLRVRRVETLLARQRVGAARVTSIMLSFANGRSPRPMRMGPVLPVASMARPSLPPTSAGSASQECWSRPRTSVLSARPVSAAQRLEAVLSRTDASRFSRGSTSGADSNGWQRSSTRTWRCWTTSPRAAPRPEQ